MTETPGQRVVRYGFALAILVMIATAVGRFVSRSTPPSPSPAAAAPVARVITDADKQSTTRLIAAAVDAHVVKRVDVANHEAQVFHAAWVAFDADAKRGLVLQLAQYCDYAGTFHDAQYVTVIDAQSGQELASYDPFGVHLR